ncbi:MAG: hypothetical protein NT166_27470 [Candidatus Aminicenantes bacterium]|nr:hypothetical protein [Candidatus Aminicenantes bacterium]
MMDKEIEALGKLFELEKIKQIICVDDQYREFDEYTINDFIGYIASDEEIKTKIKNGVEELGNLIWDDDAHWKNQLTGIWSDADNAKRKSLYEQLIQFIPGFPNHDNQKKDEDYLGALEELLKQLRNIDLKKLSYSQWTKDYGRGGELLIDDDLEKKGTLFLFDQDYSNESECGGTNDGGINIIKSLFEKHRNTPIMCGLLSHTFEPYEEYKRWDDFARDPGIDKDRLVLIAKRNLTEDKPGFVRGVRRTILSKYCKTLKDQTSVILKESLDQSKKELDKLSIYDFEQIVFRSAYDEGIWETDTLFRLYNIYQKNFIRQEIMKSKELLNSTARIREISKISKESTLWNQSELKKIHQLEYYEEGKQINGLHMPIGLGDIFIKTASTSQRKFILIAQPCNLMVRTSKNLEGKRAYNFHEAVLAEIFNGTCPQNEFCIEILYFDANSGTPQYIDLQKTYSVLLCIIDLCVFNKEGLARMSSDYICPSEIIPAWKYRFKKLKDRFDEIIEECIELKSKGFDEAFLKKHLLPKSSHEDNGLFKPKIDLTKNGKESITYDCRRIRRLCRPQAEAILLKYSHYISRSAFDHDFGKKR